MAKIIFKNCTFNFGTKSNPEAALEYMRALQNIAESGYETGYDDGAEDAEEAIYESDSEFGDDEGENSD